MKKKTSATNALFLHTFHYKSVQLFIKIHVKKLTSVAKASRFLSPPESVFKPSRPPSLVFLAPYKDNCLNNWLTLLFRAKAEVRRSMRRRAYKQKITKAKKHTYYKMQLFVVFR